jgi:hypothetical protein
MQPSLRETGSHTVQFEKNNWAGWLECRRQEVIQGHPGRFTGASKLPAVFRRLTEAMRSQALPEQSAYGIFTKSKSKNTGSFSGVPMQAFGDLPPFDLTVPFHCSCEVHPGSDSRQSSTLTQASAKLLDLFGCSKSQLSDIQLEHLVDLSSSVHASHQLHLRGDQVQAALTVLSEGATVKLTSVGQHKIDGMPSTAVDAAPFSRQGGASASSIFANVIAFPCWSHTAPTELSSADVLLQPFQSMWLLVFEPIRHPQVQHAFHTLHPDKAGCHNFPGNQANLLISNASKSLLPKENKHSRLSVVAFSACADTGTKKLAHSVAPQNEGPIVLPKYPHNAYRIPSRALRHLVNPFKALGEGENGSGGAVRDALALSSGPTMLQGMVLSRSSSESKCVAVREQLQRKVKHDKDSRRILLTLCCNALCVALYVLYTVYLVLATSSNPLFSLRFRQPTIISQLHGFPLSFFVWRQAAQALAAGPVKTFSEEHAALSQNAISGVEAAQRADAKFAAIQVSQAIQDLSLLDKIAGQPGVSMADSWNRLVPSATSNHTTLRRVQSLLAEELGAIELANPPKSAALPFSCGAAEQSQAAWSESNALTSLLNATASGAVVLLNSSNHRTFRLGTFFVLFLLAAFASATLTAASIAERRLIQRAVDALQPAIQDQVHALASTACGISVASHSHAFIDSDSSSPPTRTTSSLNVMRWRGFKIDDWLGTAGLQYEVTCKVSCALFLGASIIVVAIVSRYGPEDTQATSVNAVYAAQQLNSAAFRITVDLDSSLRHMGSCTWHNCSTINSTDAQVALIDYTHWQRVLFSQGRTEFMFSAAPGQDARAMLFGRGSAGHTMMFADACVGTTDVTTYKHASSYTPFIPPIGVKQRMHAASCNTIFNGILKEGWQQASYAYFTAARGIEQTLQSWAVQPNITFHKSCFVAMRYAIWNRIASALFRASEPSQYPTAVPSAQTDFNAHEVLRSTCPSANSSFPLPFMGSSEQALRFVDLVTTIFQLQAVHFTQLAEATVEFSADEYRASLVTHATETLLSLSIAHVLLLCFIRMVGNPAALGKRKIVQAAQLMNSLLLAEQAV